MKHKMHTWIAPNSNMYSLLIIRMACLPDYSNSNQQGNVSYNNNHGNFQILFHWSHRICLDICLPPCLSVVKRKQATDPIGQWGNRKSTHTSKNNWQFQFQTHWPHCLSLAICLSPLSHSLIRKWVEEEGKAAAATEEGEFHSFPGQGLLVMA